MELSGINLNLMTALDALLRERHVGRAASKLGITQSALSHQLRQLRDLLDDPLLVRAGNEMVPTPRAEALAPRLRDGLLAFQDALRSRDELRPEELTREFTLLSLDGTAALIVPWLFARLSREAPRARLRVLPLPKDLVAALSDERASVAILPPFDPPAGVRMRPAYESGLSVLCRADHPLLERPLTLKRFCEVPHVVMSLGGAPATFVDHALEKLGKQRFVALRVPYMTLLPAAVAQSDAIALVPTGAVPEFEALWPVRGVALPKELKFPNVPMFIAWHERLDADPSERWFRELIFEHVAMTAPPS